MAGQLYSRSLRIYKLRYWGPWTINENSLAWLHRAAHTKQDRRAFKGRTQRAPVPNTKGHRQKAAWVDLTFGTLLCLMLLLFQGWPNSCERCSAVLSWQILGNRKKYIYIKYWGTVGENSRPPGADVQHERTMEEGWISEGLIKDEAVWWREVGAGRKEHVSLLIALILERLMDGTRHFCTHPGSLLPHSITRRSIKSLKKRRRGEKKNRKALVTGPGERMQLSLAFISTCFYAGLF